MNLLYTQEEIHYIEVYSEYLKKIPELLKQLETVEKMYQKAVLEEKMLEENAGIKNNENTTEKLYNERLVRIKKQCEERTADIIEQCQLIFRLKAQIESESKVLKELMK